MYCDTLTHHSIVPSLKCDYGFHKQVEFSIQVEVETHRLCTVPDCMAYDNGQSSDSSGQLTFDRSNHSLSYIIGGQCPDNFHP